MSISINTGAVTSQSIHKTDGAIADIVEAVAHNLEVLPEDGFSSEILRGDVGAEILAQLEVEIYDFQHLSAGEKKAFITSCSGLLQSDGQQVLTDPNCESALRVMVQQVVEYEQKLSNYLNNNVADGGDESADLPKQLLGGSNPSLNSKGDGLSDSTADQADKMINGYKKYFTGLDWNFLNKCDPVFRIGFVMLMLMKGPYGDIFDDIAENLTKGGIYITEINDVKSNLDGVRKFFNDNAASINDGIDVFQAFYYYMWQNHPDQCNSSQPPQASLVEQGFANAVSDSFFANMYSQLQQYNQSNPNNQISASMLANGDTNAYEDATSISQVPQQAFMHYYVTKPNQVAREIVNDPTSALFPPAWTSVTALDSFFQQQGNGSFQFTFTKANVQNGVGGESSGVNNGVIGRCNKLGPIALASKTTIEELLSYYDQVWANSVDICSFTVNAGNFSWLNSN